MYWTSAVRNWPPCTPNSLASRNIVPWSLSNRNDSLRVFFWIPKDGALTELTHFEKDCSFALGDLDRQMLEPLVRQALGGFVLLVYVDFRSMKLYQLCVVPSQSPEDTKTSRDSVFLLMSKRRRKIKKQSSSWDRLRLIAGAI